MEIQNLIKPFEVEHFEVDECPCKRHMHTYFEITYIRKGTGEYNINGNIFNYKENDLFLVPPGSDHFTNVKSTTSFLFIRFNNIYLQAQYGTDKQFNALSDWMHKLEYILQNGSHLKGQVNLQPEDQPLSKAVFEAILQGLDSQKSLQNELMLQLINTTITVIARNISMHHTKESSSDTGHHILQFIHQHIHEPQKLKSENIAAHFNISPNYVSEYFKKHTHGSMQQYIMQYKLSLIDIRLRHSDMRLNEIADEFGFTDESHFTKTFKKYKGISPSAFRKSLTEESAAPVCTASLTEETR
ncbi:AraC family transcriptional regulator [Pseudoflavitalea sp. G-6-1-2]|uniref:AraC family transcriptional regulator n=1 Tax=Pseudoflavitalea sp. G-6-1-2 TaxID=2728841 RepID=UPI00146CAED6|nr:helix-turn-helix domain-containing protein [Pseudoflavitalea sp. G-6-1-2]NML22896.1 AraC family transcriptional regulator [Pseudoflavitalea sp. G-6-1-2]